MDITWDDRKAEANLAKHGVSFEEAATVILNPLALTAPNAHPDGSRFEYLGHSTRDRLLYVVTVERSEETVRILSARKATPYEKETYERRL